jgi:membrane fusion protein (multidrug efflux system)
MSRRTAAALLVLALALAALLWWRWRPDSGGADGASFAAFSAMPVQVTTARAAPQRFTTTTRAVGTVEAAEQVTVTSRATGIVTALRFDEGERVERGSVLVELDAGQEQAELEAARVEEEDARRQLRRLSSLREQQLIAQSDLDEARARWQSARARTAQASAALAERRITAPFAGVLGLRQVSPGALVEPGATITTLATLDRLTIGFSVSSELLPQLRRGLPVHVTAAGFDRSFEGRITQIDNRVDPATRSIDVEAELTDAQVLRPGLFVSVDVVLSSRAALAIPEQAVVFEGTQTYVYVVADGAARRRPVVLGERRPGITEVRTGLDPGAAVIVAGVQKVEDGQAVHAAPAGS